MLPGRRALAPFADPHADLGGLQGLVDGTGQVISDRIQVYGVLQVQCSEPERARERLGAALAIFRRLGARNEVERA